MDIEKRKECADILGLTKDKCAELLSKCLFTDERNLGLLTEAALFGSPRVENIKVHVFNIINELMTVWPTLTVDCMRYSPFKSPPSYYNNHPHMIEQRKSKGALYKLDYVEWKIFIKLFESDEILLELDQLTHTEMQCIQYLMIDSFLIVNNSVGFNRVTFSNFRFNESIKKYFKPELIIKRILFLIARMSPYAISFIDDVLLMLEGDTEKVMEVWEELKRENNF